MAPIIFIFGHGPGFQRYRAALEAAGGCVCFSREIGAGDGCDALVLPGGGDVAPWRYGQENSGSGPADETRDARELAVLDRFVTSKKPVLGICRGMQVLNVYFGGTLIQDLPGHDDVDHIDRLHTVRTAPSFLTGICETGDIVNSAHHQAADRLGSGLRAVQWAPDGVMEALCHETLPIWGVQWHPERLYAPLATSRTAGGVHLLRRFVKGL